MGNQLLTSGYDLEELVDEYNRRQQRNRFKTLFADREMYPKHNDFFEAGADYKQRLFMAANRVGKTYAAMCELVMHLTGDYPDWWKGKRFNHPTSWWVVGVDYRHLVSSLQPMLLGPVGAFGTGLIPEDCLDWGSMKDAVKATTSIDAIRVKHSTGAYSLVEFKSAQSGRAAFQSTERNILIDEECDASVYEECLLRTLTGNCILMMTFTPLMGLTPLILNYYSGEWHHGDGEVGEGRYAVNATWDDAPHISPEQAKQLYDSLPPHQREARSKGIPSLGSGLIYPVPESLFVIQPFDIPKHWAKLYGMDVGWKRTAAIWGAIDPESGTVYCFSEHYVAEAQPSTHAASIRARGEWIPGTIDSAANGRSQADGENLMQSYKDLGLDLVNAEKAVETGLYTVWELLSQGRLKIMTTCVETLKEIRLYRRDEKGRVMKSNDHLMDSLRYMVMKRDIAKTELQAKPVAFNGVSNQYRRGTGRQQW